MKSSMSLELSVVLCPAEIAGLPAQDLSKSTCVVFDVLRATSTMLAALNACATGVLPVTEIAEAVAAQTTRPGALLAGERGGRRITASDSDGVEFDFGNSPREMIKERVAGRLLIATTTNGTRAIRACAKAEHVLIGSFANLAATATWLTRASPSRVLLVGSGTGEDPSLEDALAVGALIDRLRGSTASLVLADSAMLANLSYQQAKPRLEDVFCEASNARRLLAMPDLAADVAWCLALDQCPFVAGLEADGIIRVLS